MGKEEQYEQQKENMKDANKEVKIWEMDKKQIRALSPREEREAPT